MIGFVCEIFKPFENLTSEDVFREPLVKIIGHRGCNQLGGENTLKGIQAALDMGVNGVEIEIVGLELSSDRLRGMTIFIRFVRYTEIAHIAEQENGSEG